MIKLKKLFKYLISVDVPLITVIPLMVFMVTLLSEVTSYKNLYRESQSEIENYLALIQTAIVVIENQELVKEDQKTAIESLANDCFQSDFKRTKTKDGETFEFEMGVKNGN